MHFSSVFICPASLCFLVGAVKSLSRDNIIALAQFSLVAQSCSTIWDPMNRSMPDLPVHHQLPVFTQTHVHRVGDAIQPFHPLSPSPPALNSSQHQGLFQWVSSLHEVAKVLDLLFVYNSQTWVPFWGWWVRLMWFLGADSLTEEAGRRVMPTCGPVSQVSPSCLLSSPQSCQMPFWLKQGLKPRGLYVLVLG